MTPAHHRQNQALIILTVGTAALAFGLFQVEFPIPTSLTHVGPGTKLNVVTFLAIMKLIFGLITFAHYLAMFRGVRRILSMNSHVSGRRLVNGPLSQLLWEIGFMALIFVIGVVELQADNRL